jgi:hypothetical protein
MHFLRGARGVVYVNDHLALTAFYSHSLTLVEPVPVKVSLATDGWVGVGTVYPEAPLHVAGNLFVEGADCIGLKASHVEMGLDTSASGYASTAMGHGTAARGSSATALGEATVATGSAATALGSHTTASGGRSTAMGSGTIASGICSVAMGVGSEATGDNTLAAGFYAKALDDGSFVWSCSNSEGAESTSMNSVTMRAGGGYRLFSNLYGIAGVQLGAGGVSWGTMSDRNLKENFHPIDPRDILEKVAQLPLTEWNLTSQNPGIRHLGPMAQDFYAAFGLGADDRYITSSDADGVALAAIQGLNQKVEQRLKAKDAEIRKLKKRLTELEEVLRTLAGNKTLLE